MAPRTENIWELFGSGTFQRDSSKKDLETGQIPFLKWGDWILGLPRFMLNLLSPTSSIATNLYNMIWTLYQSDYEYGYHKLRISQDNFQNFLLQETELLMIKTVSMRWTTRTDLTVTSKGKSRDEHIQNYTKHYTKLESARIWLPDKYPPLHRGGVQEKQIHRTLCYQARSIVQIFSYHFPIIFLSFSSLLKSTACPKRTSLCCPADSAPSLLLLQLSQALHAVLPELWPALASRMVDDTPTIDHCWWFGRGRYKLPNGISIVSFSTRAHTHTRTHAYNINIYYCIYI